MAGGISFLKEFSRHNSWANSPQGTFNSMDPLSMTRLHYYSTQGWIRRNYYNSSVQIVRNHIVIPDRSQGHHLDIHRKGWGRALEKNMCFAISLIKWLFSAVIGRLCWFVCLWFPNQKSTQTQTQSLCLCRWTQTEFVVSERSQCRRLVLKRCTGTQAHW
jgi:hypothetical protein